MPMLCVLIPVPSNEPALSETLASLVSGVVSGIVRSVVVADFCANPSLRGLCEDCGCNYSDAQHDGLRPAIGLIRSEWVMIVEPGLVLVEPWLARLRELSVMRGDVGAMFPVRNQVQRPWLSRIMNRVRPLEPRGALVLRRGRLTGGVHNWDDVVSAFKTVPVRIEYANCVVDLRKGGTGPA
jgi:hypothetical protein